MSSDSDYVLVIDDDDDLRESLGEVLRAAGHAYDTAVDGLDGLGRLRAAKNPPCVVLLDLMMPRMSGFELRSAMKADPALASIPVVVVTGAGALADRRADELDVEVLFKPVELRDLLKTVERHCAKQTAPVQ